MRFAGVAIGAVVGVLIVTAPAFGHGDLQGTSPEDGATVGNRPPRITITLTEAPSRGAEARATDGCKRVVPADVSVDGSDIVLTTGGGQPGVWKVSYRAVSSVDGHQTRGKFGFTVRGKKDCSREQTEEPEDEIDAADDPGILENPDPPDEGGTSWLLWVGVGTVVVAGAAFMVRRSSR